MFVRILVASLALMLAPRFAQAEDVTFVSHGTTLAGTIVLPKGKIVAGVVFVHGSGKQSRNSSLAQKFADAGIAALVYDKRGAGRSGGVYEQNQNVSEKNLSLLADDAKAALDALAGHAALTDVPVGFTGLSQAGWIVPIAAERSPAARFVLLWSGPVCKVSEEDIFSKFTSDRDEASPPSFAQALAARKEKYVWPDFLGRDTNSFEDLAKLNIPGLWIFSDNDASIPVDLSIDRLKALRRAGMAYDYALFSGLGHENIEGTFAQATDWIARVAAR